MRECLAISRQRVECAGREVRAMNQPPPSQFMLMAAVPSAVGRARAYARWVLDTWALSAMADTTELLISELVTNAVKASGFVDEDVDERMLIGKVNPIYLGLSVLAEILLIEVWDASTELPQRRAAFEDDESGRGLLLVQTLTKDWGCDVVASGGKIVWCKCLIRDAE
jgi:anti-sigma regulatory factor (Ser/Thr protein kinase)